MLPLRIAVLVADVDMDAVAWVRFVSVPSSMSTALSTEPFNRPRATVANQDLIVVQVNQTVEDVCAETDEVHHINTSAYACAPSFICVDTRSCVWKRSINVLETGTSHRTPTRPLEPRRPEA